MEKDAGAVLEEQAEALSPIPESAEAAIQAAADLITAKPHLARQVLTFVYALGRMGGALDGLTKILRP